VTVELQIIKPGPGNPRDRHYYPADVLKRDAHIFEGVDIYVTDHREQERSERTKVGRIKNIVRFTEEGAPVAQAVIYDGDMAEKTRNRAEAGELDTLECSIYAKGRSAEKVVDGATYNVVEAMTWAGAVEFVSKAGAGGKALALVESQGGSDMDSELEQKNDQTTEEPAEEALHESTTAPEANASAESTEAASTVATEEVEAALRESKLPPGIVSLLKLGSYADKVALDAAIADARKAVKELSESGQPFAQGHTQPPSTQPPQRTYEERLADIDRKYGLIE